MEEQRLVRTLAGCQYCHGSYMRADESLRARGRTERSSIDPFEAAGDGVPSPEGSRWML